MGCRMGGGGMVLGEIGVARVKSTKLARATSQCTRQHGSHPASQPRSPTFGGGGGPRCASHRVDTSTSPGLHVASGGWRTNAGEDKRGIGLEVGIRDEHGYLNTE